MMDAASRDGLLASSSVSATRTSRRRPRGPPLFLVRWRDPDENHGHGLAACASSSTAADEHRCPRLFLATNVEARPRLRHRDEFSSRRTSRPRPRRPPLLLPCAIAAAVLPGFRVGPQIRQENEAGAAARSLLVHALPFIGSNRDGD